MVSRNKRSNHGDNTSLDPHAFGRQAAVDIFGAITLAVTASRARMIAARNAAATARTVEEWRAVVDDQMDTIRHLAVALQHANDELTKSRTEAVIAQAGLATLQRQVAGYLRAAG